MPRGLFAGVCSCVCCGGFRRSNRGCLGGGCGSLSGRLDGRAGRCLGVGSCRGFFSRRGGGLCPAGAAPDGLFCGRFDGGRLGDDCVGGSFRGGFHTRFGGGFVGKCGQRLGCLNGLAGAAASGRGFLHGARGPGLLPLRWTRRPVPHPRVRRLRRGTSAAVLGSGLRRVRTARLTGAPTAAVSAVPSATIAASLSATTWSLSICGDTPAPGHRHIRHPLGQLFVNTRGH